MVIAIILSSLAYYCADASASRTSYDGSLEAATEDCAQYRSASTADKSTFARADAALIAAVVVMIRAVAIIVVAGIPPTAASHALIVVAIVAVLGWKNAGDKKKRDGEDRCSELAHFRLDAGLRLTWRGNYLLSALTFYTRKSFVQIYLFYKELGA
jgi:hypothetical protein